MNSLWNAIKKKCKILLLFYFIIFLLSIGLVFLEKINSGISNKVSTMIGYIIVTGIPSILTLINVFHLIGNLFVKKEISYKWYKMLGNIDLLTIMFGIIYNTLFWIILGMPDYDDKIRYGESGLFSPLNNDYLLTILIIFVLGYISFVILKKKGIKLPPLILAINLSILLISNIIMMMYLYQLSTELFENEFYEKSIYFFKNTTYLALFPFNYLIISFILSRKVIKEYTFENKKINNYKNKILNFLNKIVINSSNLIFPVMIFMIPILLLIITILILFGQQPDSIIKAFTETSGWKLSQYEDMIPLEYGGGHYLCTVSLRGHKKVVKP